jgi:hypothetical protein
MLESFPCIVLTKSAFIETLKLAAIKNAIAACTEVKSNKRAEANGRQAWSLRPELQLVVKGGLCKTSDRKKMGGQYGRVRGVGRTSWSSHVLSCTATTLSVH